MSRYSRHIILKEIGLEGQQKIKASKVLVIGAGGLGCPVLQYLTAAGVGTIGIVDFDTVALSNLQRQILYKTSAIGENKAEAARMHLLELNPTISINTYPERLTPKNIETLFSEYDIIVDGTDNYATRYLISDAAILLNKPVVYGAIYKFEGQVTVFNYKNGPSYRCIFPNPPKRESIANCSEIGVLGVLPGIIGTMQANEVLKLILEIGKPLSGKLYCFNALTYTTMTIDIKRNESEIEAVKDRGFNFQTNENHFRCTIAENNEIEITSILKDEIIQYIDVRALSETPRIKKKHVLEIPLDELSNRIKEISKKQKIIVFCQSGVRSKKAVAVLKSNNISNCFSLKEGVQAFAEKDLIQAHI